MKGTIISMMCMTIALMLAASCNKIEDKPVSVEGNGRSVINGVAEAIGGGTKAYNKYSYEVLWNENDQIWVTDGTKDDTFTLTDGEDTPKGVFTEDGTKGITGNIEAFYPASLKTDDGYVWPATQSNNQVAPMYAKQSISGTENEVVSFSSLGAMLQIAFSTTASSITLTSITLKNASKPLSGLFTVSDGQAIMEENSANPGVTLDLGTSGVPVGVAAKYFYIAIPAGDYNGDKLTLTFTDDVHHKECVMTSTTFPNVDRNTVGRITLAGNFQNQKFTVKFDMNNTGLTGNFRVIKPADLTNLEANKTIMEPERVFYAENYGFRGWYKEATCENAWDFANDKVAGDMTLYAKWEEDPTGGTINGRHNYVKLAGYYWAITEAGTAKNRREAETAEAKWDSPWKLPTRAQWKALCDNCDWTYEGDLYDGVFIVSGKEENFEAGHSMSLPGVPLKSYFWAQEGNNCYRVYLDQAYWILPPEMIQYEGIAYSFHDMPSEADSETTCFVRLVTESN